MSKSKDTNVFSEPDAFSQAPLLALLPSRGDLKKLEAQHSALYARLEKVESLHKELSGSSNELGVSRRLLAEQLMLRQVLDWVSMKESLKERS